MIGDKRSEQHGERKRSQHNPSVHRGGGRWGPWWLRWKQHCSYFYIRVSTAVQSALYLFALHTMAKTASPSVTLRCICMIVPSDRPIRLFIKILFADLFSWVGPFSVHVNLGQLLWDTLSHVCGLQFDYITIQMQKWQIGQSTDYQTKITEDYGLFDGCGAGCVRETGVLGQ